ncbi:ATP-utilizing chromatin assembly and remodelling N-terminal-domain-containing protein [Chlamydoabsidia padenii]|nr:ATP-utilizing chromatin assembly and remodelling N-terminal-domain-containing protein [Chlamydoabsidia padenii]
MPLLKRKQFSLVASPPLDLKNKSTKSSPVWYSPLTHEIFDNYSHYLERVTLYKRPIWQCEFTGRSNLTYSKALESERLQNETVQNKLPKGLQRAILERAQFQTARLIDVVDDVYGYLSDRFVLGEQVDCIWDDNLYYSAIVLKAPPLVDQVSDDVKYKIQLLDQDYKGLPDYTKNVQRKDLKRDRLIFSKTLLKKFLREATVKDAYIGAPWIINNQFAERFDISNKLPQHLEAAKILAYSKSRKLKLLIPPKKQQEFGITGSSTTSHTLIVPTAKTRIEEARKFESALKYPMEDLDLPTYRRNPPTELSSVFLDMSPGSGNELKTVPNPTGDWPLRPAPSYETVPSDCFGSFLMVWQFLGVFSGPLHLSPFSLDDFESALCHSSMDQSNQLIYEIVATLLNCIIQYRLQGGYQYSTHIFTSPTENIHATSLASHQQLYQSINHDDISLSNKTDDSNSRISDDDCSIGNKKETSWDANGQQSTGATSYQPTKSDDLASMERGCGSVEVIDIGKNWDAKPIPAGNNRQGWIDVLIGCINDLAIEANEEMASFDRILCCLVPRLKSDMEERQQAFLQLDLKDKLLILKLLTNVANESSDIKEYMEECQEKLTELRKHRIEANRERKQILAERNDLEKQCEDTPNDEPSEASEYGDDSDKESANEKTIDYIQKKAAHLSRHNPRQTNMKRKLMEQEELEAKRKKLRHQQRQVAKEKNQEQRIRNLTRKKLENEEYQVQKKLEQVDRDMRKYNTLRLKPLGRDKFYNRYYYLDNIGGGCLHGSGKLFVQSPSPADLAVILASDIKKDPSTTLTAPTEMKSSSIATGKNTVASLCGHGGGLQFLCSLMEHQGLPDKAALLKTDIDRMVGNDQLEWWESFDDPKQLNDLIEWLNPKGVREYLLKQELQKHSPGLLAGMKKTQMERSNKEAKCRSTRSKPANHLPLESWQTYTNKLAI